MKRIRESLALGSKILSESGILEPVRDASLLMSLALKRDRAFLIAHSEYVLSDVEYKLFLSYVKRRARGEPIQYIRESQEFYGLEFTLSKDVLIPRPETELIVETSIEFLRSMQNAKILDVGIGSGCIAISILHNLEHVEAVGVDVSESALNVAKMNALKHKVMGRLELRHSNLFDAIDSREKFDLIVSNPPYVSESEFELLQRDVRDYEPKVALIGGSDGLSIIRRIIADSAEYLKSKGRLVMEIGFGQADQVSAMMDDRWQDFWFLTDLQGIKRVLIAEKAFK
ncbi:MAG: peptide chain release factor N(5)-glutamine methyltransferase [Pyrinomonadaceae bacterium]|nr:peptide chain release factor N(5)-glutamine methyltransferase [Pyrinomonadaceae bacterium]MCX7639424.1 peptide chain release factor N(5)-glutamine methyltransferase [Pyrinomonadaceae bacterium]MDW8304526.1 peptide chain release factor N(5)-glutamine methyltransferase [Acidobacteriota bacterium]